MKVFGRIDNYDAMLWRIGLSTFVVTIVVTGTLSASVPQIHAWLVDLDYVKLPESLDVVKNAQPGVIGTGLLGLLLSRGLRLHDRISDLFRIRRNFDVRYILIPMAGETNRKLTLKKIDQLEANRRKLMQKVFFKYASSSEGLCVIDKHLVSNALDWWSHYWCLIEAVAVLLVGALVASWFHSYNLAVFYLCAVLLLLLLAQVIKLSKCVSASREEIEAILEDKEREKAVGDAISALQD